MCNVCITSDEEFQDVGPPVNDDQRPLQPQPTPSLPNLPPVVGRNPFLDVSLYTG